MAINWNFNANDYEEKTFTPIPVGDHRVRIASAEEQTSQSGNQMIKLVLDVSGYNSTIWYYLVFMPDNQKMTNQKIGDLCNSFGITPGDFNLSNWIGKIGGARVKHDTYNGEVSPKVNYFISKEKQEKLPTWVEPSNKAELTGQTTAKVDVAVDDLPWE